MGVYINGMEMPKTCDDCKAFVCYRQWAGDSGDCFCGITKSDAKDGVRNADCPLVPVPPHGRLIDADEFLHRAIGTKCFRGDYALMLEELAGESTTIIEAEEGE